MKTIIYLRTSTEEQNPQNQLKECLTIYKKEWGEYETLEDKQSAWKEHIERENFNKLKKQIVRGWIKHLIVWDLDRIYRNRKNLVSFFKLCEEKKCQIHSFRQNWLDQINTMPPPWNEIVRDLMIQVMGWIAQDESDKKSQRVKAAMRQKDDGVYSYRGKKWGRKKIPKSAVEGVLKHFWTGFSVRKIASRVFYRDKRNRKRNVSKSAVQQILQEKIGKDYLKRRADQK